MVNIYSKFLYQYLNSYSLFSFSRFKLILLKGIVSKKIAADNLSFFKRKKLSFFSFFMNLKADFQKPNFIKNGSTLSRICKKKFNLKFSGID